MTELQRAIAVAIRWHKFERTRRKRAIFDEDNITPEELGEAQAAIDAYHKFMRETYTGITK